MPDDWRTIRIPGDDFERHNEQRQQMGLTWAEYIDGERPPSMADEALERIREIVREETRAAIEAVAR